jgi:hypothetical protein
MIDLLHLGQGPRPDLLEKELQQEERIRQAEALEESSEGEPDHSLPSAEGESSKSRETKERTRFEKKDAAAIIIALFQLVLPWLLLGIGIFTAVILLLFY